MRIMTGGEEGQTLILFALMLAVLVVFVVMVVDVGMFMETRRHAQNVDDAAALAGAQELPDNPTAAATVARQYADLNGYDSSRLQISFQCTSNVAVACNPSINKYDTILVKATADFAGLLRTDPERARWWGPVLDDRLLDDRPGGWLPRALRRPGDRG